MFEKIDTSPLKNRIPCQHKTLEMVIGLRIISTNYGEAP